MGRKKNKEETKINDTFEYTNNDENNTTYDNEIIKPKKSMFDNIFVPLEKTKEQTNIDESNDNDEIKSIDELIDELKETKKTEDNINVDNLSIRKYRHYLRTGKIIK